VVDAGFGHRAEIQIPADRLTQVTGPKENRSTTPADAAEDPPAPTPQTDRSSPVSVKDVLLGIGLLLAAAAFVLSLRNAQKLRELKKANEEASRPRSREGPG
jgi:hypothetical protein